MRYPFNRIQIYTCLVHIPQWRQFTQFAYRLAYQLNGVINILDRGETTDTESDGAVRQLIIAAQQQRQGNLNTALVQISCRILAILVVVYLGAASGLGLYSAGTLEDALVISPQLLLDVLVLVVLWLIIRRVVTR